MHSNRWGTKYIYDLAETGIYEGSMDLVLSQEINLTGESVDNVKPGEYYFLANLYRTGMGKIQSALATGNVILEGVPCYS